MEVSMFLSRSLFSRTAALAGLAAVALLWAARPATAQLPIGAVSKFDRANAVAAQPGAYYAPWYAPKAPAPPPRPSVAFVAQPTPGPTTVTIRYPASEPVYATLRGPNGEVQRFPLESGPESIRTRTVIVRRGETASFTFAVAPPPK
jgi:hypothetical protein